MNEQKKSYILFFAVMVALGMSIVLNVLQFGKMAELRTSLQLATTDSYDSVEYCEQSVLPCIWQGICYEESRLNASAYNPRTDAKGIGQITPAMVSHVNQIQSDYAFKANDAFDPQLSYIMFEILVHHHGLTTIDEIIDKWNPRCTEAYRRNVKANIADILTEGVEL